MLQLLKSVYRGWVKGAHFIGRINATILLTVFYFTFLAVAKLVTQLAGKDLLDSRWRDRSSYWKNREGFRVDRDTFLRPY